MKRAFIQARKCPGGSNLCLERLNAELWWQGKGGMIISQLRGRIRTMLKFEGPPHYLIVHVGANDLGNLPAGDLRNEIKKNLRVISRYHLLGTKIVWSQMLPRFNWRYSSDLVKMERCRYRTNNAVASYVLKYGGYYIRYPEIIRDRRLFEADGVHLSLVANNIFLNKLQGGIEYFLDGRGNVFPPQ